ncbi:heme o synthase [Thiotrichales bacterium HSG14]|nr:heme o synthase [Thiotrichales bacterium HSG14]
MIQQLVNLFKLRIGIIMAVTAVAILAITPGPTTPTVWQMVILALAVLLSSASAGAFNQYMERDLDKLMPRTRNRPFVTGAFSHSRWWLLSMLVLLLVGVAMAGFALNMIAALYIFLGAVTYGVVYTVWLKRRTWLNIVIGGAAGSFAVLAGAAVVDPNLTPIPVIFAIVLFLWTPSHFWSLAIVQHKDYAKAGVPMLPVIIGDHATAKVILANTLALVAISLLPIFFGLQWIYLMGAMTGGGYFLFRNIQLVRDPSPKIAMSNFFASLIQLIVLLAFAVVDVQLLG